MNVILFHIKQYHIHLLYYILFEEGVQASFLYLSYNQRFTKDKNMNGQKEYQKNRKNTMGSQYKGNRIKNHAKQSADKRSKKNCSQQPAFFAEFSPIKNKMENTQQKKERCGQFVKCDTGDRHQTGYGKTEA